MPQYTQGMCGLFLCFEYAEVTQFRSQHWFSDRAIVYESGLANDKRCRYVVIEFTDATREGDVMAVLLYVVMI